jgi:hypothetical protein
VLVVIEVRCNKQWFATIDDMIMQRIKFVAIMLISTKINCCLLFYRNAMNLNSSLQINCTACILSGIHPGYCKEESRQTPTRIPLYSY